MHGDEATRDEGATDWEWVEHELERVSIYGQSAWSMIGALLGFLVIGVLGFYVDADPAKLPANLNRDAAKALVSILLILAGSYLVIVMSQAVVISHYTRELERFARLKNGKLTVDEAERSHFAHPNDQVLAGLETLLATLISPRHGIKSMRRVFRLVLAALVAIMIALVFANIYAINNHALRYFLYGVALVFSVASLRLGYRSNIRGQELWNEVKTQAIARMDGNYSDPVKATFSLIRYLILPRKTDLFVKGLMLHAVPGLIGVAFWCSATPRWTWEAVIDGLRAVGLSFVAFEFLFYQARYMLNDYFGLSDDKIHPGSSPSVEHPTWGSRSSRLATLSLEDATADENAARRSLFWAVLVARVLLAFIMVHALAGSFKPDFFIAFLVIGLATLVYELLRTFPAEKNDLSRYSSRDLAIYGVVSVGYGIRVGLGLLVGSQHTFGWPPLILAAVAFCLTGLSSVLATWALECTQFAASSPLSPQMRVAIFGKEATSDPHLMASAVDVDQPLMAPIPDRGAMGTKLHIVPLGVSSRIFVHGDSAHVDGSDVRKGADQQGDFRDARMDTGSTVADTTESMPKASLNARPSEQTEASRRPPTWDRSTAELLARGRFLSPKSGGVAPWRSPNLCMLPIATFLTSLAGVFAVSVRLLVGGLFVCFIFAISLLIWRGNVLRLVGLGAVWLVCFVCIVLSFRDGWETIWVLGLPSSIVASNFVVFTSLSFRKTQKPLADIDAELQRARRILSALSK